MSDSRSISGSVKTESKDTVAQVAYDMASSMWFEQYGSHPKVDDRKFIYLVGTCSRALGGSQSLGAVESWVKKTHESN